MLVKTVKTAKIRSSEKSINEVLDESLLGLNEKSIVAVTSKIISLCENRVMPMKGTDKEALVRREAERYISAEDGKYGYQFTITQNTLIPSSGIDESNGDGYYILWPADPQKSANLIRDYLKKRFSLKNVGVIITDSTCMPLRWGTIGIALVHSGFKPLNSYVGNPDLFGRPFKVSRAGVASGLAAAAVVAMGEGAEQTPIAVIEDIPFVEFQARDPTEKDIAELLVRPEDDLYGPFLESVEWSTRQNGTP